MPDNVADLNALREIGDCGKLESIYHFKFGCDEELVMRQLMVAYQIITMNNNCSACVITISSAGNTLESRKNSFFPVPFQDELACGVGSGSCINANA